MGNMVPDNLFWPKKKYMFIKLRKICRKYDSRETNEALRGDTFTWTAVGSSACGDARVAEVCLRTQALNCDQLPGLPVLHIRVLVPGSIKCGVMSSFPHTYLLFNYAQDETLSALQFYAIDLSIWTLIYDILRSLCVVAPVCTRKLTGVIDQ